MDTDLDTDLDTDPDTDLDTKSINGLAVKDIIRFNNINFISVYETPRESLV